MYRLQCTGLCRCRSCLRPECPYTSRGGPLRTGHTVHSCITLRAVVAIVAGCPDFENFGTRCEGSRRVGRQLAPAGSEIYLHFGFEPLILKLSWCSSWEFDMILDQTSCTPRRLDDRMNLHISIAKDSQLLIQRTAYFARASWKTLVRIENAFVVGGTLVVVVIAGIIPRKRVCTWCRGRRLGPGAQRAHNNHLRGSMARRLQGQ